MKLRRAALAAVAAWLIVVLVGASVVWAVISRAGQELVAGPVQPGISQPTASPEIIEITGDDGPIQRRSDGPSPTNGPEETESSAPTETSSPSPAPGSSSAPPRGPSSPASSAPPAPQKRTKTWAGPPGSVTVTCEGDRLSFVVSQNPGWGVEPPERSGNQVEVHFHATKGDSEYEVTGRCVSGVPAFASKHEEHDD